MALHRAQSLEALLPERAALVAAAACSAGERVAARLQREAAAPVLSGDTLTAALVLLEQDLHHLTLCCQVWGVKGLERTVAACGSLSRQRRRVGCMHSDRASHPTAPPQALPQLVLPSLQSWSTALREAAGALAEAPSELSALHGQASQCLARVREGVSTACRSLSAALAQHCLLCSSSDALTDAAFDAHLRPDLAALEVVGGEDVLRAPIAAIVAAQKSSLERANAAAAQHLAALEALA